MVHVSANLSGCVETFHSDALLIVWLGSGTNTSWLGLEKLGNHVDSNSNIPLHLVPEYSFIFMLPNVGTQS